MMTAYQYPVAWSLALCCYENSMHVVQVPQQSPMDTHLVYNISADQTRSSERISSLIAAGSAGTQAMHERIMPP